MFQVRSWPNVILHLDGDAFFVSVLQSMNPSLKGKPVVAGSERGIATAMSYEAKKYGIKRAMRISEVKKLCPDCIILDSDYELYALYSARMFTILRSFSPTVEEYSIDEAFVDLKGLRRPLNMNYRQIGEAIKNKIEDSLDISVSVGISLTKSLAKLASNSQKPSGLTVVNGLNIAPLLEKTPVASIWGVGENTSAYLKKFGINTAIEFVSKSEDFIKKYFSKPFLEIWRELRGEKIYEIDPVRKTAYKSMQSTQTFHPATTNSNFLWGRLLEHIEQVFQRARFLNYEVGRISIFLKTQQFKYHQTEIVLSKKSSYPLLLRSELKTAFEKIYDKNSLYRATGAIVSNFEKITAPKQTDLFSNTHLEEKMKKIYPLFENEKVKFATSLLLLTIFLLSF
jgi:DNA polymerase-4/DNA polymerase V